MRVLLIIPPFGGLDRPSLGVHTLQSSARKQGHEIDVFYSNMAFAARIGEVPYMSITTFGTTTLMGERIMGLSLGAAVPEPLLEKLNKEVEHEAGVRGIAATRLTLEGFIDATEAWLADVTATVTRKTYDIIGFSTTFEQTNGLAILAKHCRRLFPKTTLIAGGANCEGHMAPAIRRFVPEIDLVFSGESELSFVRYLGDPEEFSGQRIISSPPNPDLSSLPPLDYTEFFDQLDHWLPESHLRRLEDIRLPYESSRGCWWGQKHHCTFCGLNGNGMGYREKKPEQVLTEIAQLAQATGVRRIGMTDNIMPFTYFNTLIPRLAAEDLKLDIFYEQKANIALDKVIALKAAGVNRIQPGIEALHDDLLRLMRKGTSAKQNIALLRYSRSVGISLDWNLLSGFPGDQERWYTEVLHLLPVLAHLEPPSGIHKLNFDRFSPYFETPAQFGISDLRPLPAYKEAFPTCSDYLDTLAYHFIGDCDGHTVDNSEVLRQLKAAVTQWQKQWDLTEAGRSIPCLEVVEIDANNYLLIDTRPIPNALFMQQINPEQASVALSFHNEESAATRWGQERAVSVKAKDGYIPLACAAPSVLQRFEKVRAPDLQDAAV